MENGKYKYELHCHTDEVSNCGRVPAAELVEIFRARGYDGVVITDHYSQMTYKKLKCLHPDNEFFLKGYLNAKEAAGKDFTVLLGMEIRGFCSPIDFLVYGVTEEFVRNAGNLIFKYSHRFYRIAKKNNLLVIGAHPFRMFPFLPGYRVIDGAEIYNSKESPENNAKALAWAKKHNLRILTSGSDFHRTTHSNFGGILTDEPIKTNEDLLEVLRSGRYKLIKQENQ